MINKKSDNEGAHLSESSKSALEVWKDNAAVLDDGGQRSDLEYDLGDNAEGTFAAEDHVVEVWTGGCTRHLRTALEGHLRIVAATRHHAHPYDQVLDVTVDVLLHSAGARRHPAAETVI